MAYWWVFQGDSFRRARSGGYLWAPKVGQRGQRQTYWTNMSRVQPGDVIFSGVDKNLLAVSTASALAFDADPPDLKDRKKWPQSGWRLEVSYVDVRPAVPYTEFIDRLAPMLPSRNAPFNRDSGKTNLGYLYSLPIEAGELLTSIIESRLPNTIARAIENEPRTGVPNTTRKALVEARIGQGPFRDALMEYWGRQCAVTDCTRPELLRASHIKPWNSSNHQERLDKFNGLLLSANYDAAFDALLITFSDEGRLLLADDFSNTDAIAGGIDPRARLRSVDPRHNTYLTEHRRLFELRQRRRE